jgi:hypothetical protein
VVVVTGFLFVALVGVSLACAGMVAYFLKVVRPQLTTATSMTDEGRTMPRDALATVIEQLQELAVLRDKGILTSREFSSKKSELLERI